MSDLGFTVSFALAALATWRITHLLAEEDGPADIIVRIRARLGSGLAGQLMDCFYCLSFWVAAPLAFFVVLTPIDLFVTWVALSGTACLLQGLTQRGTAAVVETGSQK
jgi:Protein of unknown function (DUF1360)